MQWNKVCKVWYNVVWHSLGSSRKSVHERPRNSDGLQVKWSVLRAIWLKRQDPQLSNDVYEGGVLLWSKWLKTRVFSKKRPEKQLFLVSRFWITWLRSGLGPPILEVLPFWIFSMKSVGHKVSNELWGGMLASMLSDRQPLEFFLESIAKKCKNGQFFAFSQIKWDFATASYIQGTTMWKLTSWRLRKCITYWVLNFLNRSYCCSKSDEGEI